MYGASETEFSFNEVAATDSQILGYRNRTVTAEQQVRGSVHLHVLLVTGQDEPDLDPGY